MSDVLVYLHGFNSSPGSAKGQLVARGAAALIPPVHVHRPQLPPHPARAVAQVSAWIDANVAAPDHLAIAGSSLGGFYATVLAERFGCRAIVINPAVRPYASLESFLGPQVNPYTGERYELTRAELEQFEALHVARITRPERYLLLVRSGDELLDWREAVRYYAGAFQYVGGGGDHGWIDFAPMVPTVLQFALGRS